MKRLLLILILLALFIDVLFLLPAIVIVEYVLIRKIIGWGWK